MIYELRQYTVDPERWVAFRQWGSLKHSRCSSNSSTFRRRDSSKHFP